MTVSAKEMRKILDEAMKEIDSDPDESSRLRAAAAPLRLEFTDVGLALNISRGDAGRLSWDFRRRAATKAKLGLKMESETGNRLMQGHENPAIAIARGRLQTTVTDPLAAVRLFPAMKPLFAHYRELVSEKYPHLAVDAE